MRRDLALVVAFACLALVVALLPTAVWLRSAVLIPLVLVLPGYALASIFFPPRSVSPAERGIYAVGLSIAVAAIGGLLLQLVTGLDRYSWAVLLAGLTILIGMRGLLIEARETEPLGLARPWGLPLAVAVFLTAALVAALAIASAGDGLREAQAKVGFTDFWMLPTRGARDNGTFSVGLRKHGGGPSRYLLQLSRGGRPIALKRPELHTGKRWERDFTLASAAGAAPIVATLSRNGKPFRRLELEMPR